MKRTLGILMVLAALLSGCAMVQPEKAETIRYHNYFGVSADNVCYLETAQGVGIPLVSGKSAPMLFEKNFKDAFLYVSAGRQLLGVIYLGSDGNRTSYSREATYVPFNFKAGNCYMVDYTIHGENNDRNISYTIKEITEPAHRKQAEQRLASFKEKLLELDKYLTFSKKAPSYFEGKWVTDAGKTLEFTGNKFKFAEEPEGDGFSGTFIFDENTIVIDITMYNSSPNLHMSSLGYKRDGNSLSIS
ncbi:MAG: hypothetical protein LBC09_00085, partial [Helicobacteraceae bacterium]|nr:hypothetical protein [Helicobacteraceae bacterium]